MSMFARFFRRDASSSSIISTNAATTQKDNDSDDGKSDDSNDNAETLDLTVEIGGNRGWTANATVILYHRVQGVICVGTEGGAVYVYGDGFQYVRTWLTEDPNEVVSLVALHPNKILVAFADNSLVVLELPTLEVIDLLPSSWLSPKDGDLTSIHCDLPSEKNFVFCGTSEGNVFVLDVMETAVRICDYCLTPADLGFAGQSLAISDLHLSPKSDRYLAVGCDGPDLTTGLITVFDLEKHKLYKSFKTPAVSTITWHHAGEMLYCGTRNGLVLSIHVEKGSCVESWRARGELIDQDEDEDDEEKIVTIRKLSWLAPQSTAVTDTGCLFASLSTGAADNDNLQNVIVGLSPLHGELTTIFSLPPIPSTKIVNFGVVPTYSRAAKSQNADENVDIVPALLLLTSTQDPLDKSKYERSLKILRCPASPLNEWALEIGALPDPRNATEVQPAASEVTCIKGILPRTKSPLSIARALLGNVLHDDENVVSTASIQTAPTLQSVLDETHAVEDSERIAVNRRASQSRRLSTREFFEKNAHTTEGLDASFAESDAWELVLTAGEHEEKSDDKRELRRQDIVFNGHADGTVVAFGVSLPDNRPEVGRGNVWLPLSVLRCGTTSVTAIAADEACGLLCCGDEAGTLVLHEIYDPLRAIGATDILRWIHDKVAAEAEDAAADLNTLKSIDEFSQEHLHNELRRYQGDYCFTQLRQVFRIRVNEGITVIYVLSALHTVVVGTVDGSVFYCNTHSDLKNGNLRKVNGIASTGACGAVTGITYGYHAKHASSLAVYPAQLGFAFYVQFESGHHLVVDAESFAVRAFHVLLNKVNTASSATAAAAATGSAAVGVNTIALLSGTNKLVKDPTPFAFLYSVSRTKQLVAVAAAVAAADAAAAASAVEGEAASSSSSAPQEPPAPPVRRGFFFGSSSSSFNANTASSSSNGVANTVGTPPPAGSSLSPTATAGVVELSTQAIAFSPNIDAPAKLFFARGCEAVTLSLDKFFPAGKRLDSLRSIAQSVTGAVTKPLFKQRVVSSALYTLTDEESAPSDGFDAFELRDGDNFLACLDEAGWLALLSLRRGVVVAHHNLLEGVVEGESATLCAGALLSNGNCYLLQQRGATTSMLYSAAVSGSDQRLAFALPDRAVPLSRSVEPALMLLHGREALLASLRATIKKRRSSVINLTAAPTDLYKIFAKTREQRAKDELLDRDEGESATTPSNAAKCTNSKAVRAMDDMQQLQQNFAERGERINRIALKMDDFKQSAQEFKQTAHAQKELLKQKNARWGLF